MAAPDSKAVIFDCFGVLYLDATQSLSVKFPKVADELKDLNRQADYGYISRHDYVQAVSELTDQSEDQIVEFIHKEHVLNEPLVRKIKTLKKSYKIGLLSNIGRDWMNDFFDTHALHEYFDAVVVSGDEGIAKPHPHIFEIIAERLDVSAGECIMIDDIEANCSGADAAGMKTIHFTDNEKCVTRLKKLLA